ncbi:MAG: hypothetical protein ACPHJ3_16575 [Rubripirellula sp.]
MLDKPFERERLEGDPITLVLLETELRIPMLGLATFNRELDLEGETALVVPNAVFLDVENLEF